VVRIETTTTPPEWLTAVLADDPEVDLWVAFEAQPELFSRMQKVADHGVEYAGGHGMNCAQPIEAVVAYRIGPDGETVGVRGVTVTEEPEAVVEAKAAPKPAVKGKGK
jgi:hypothetical protein